jgi:hypothetical protein
MIGIGRWELLICGGMFALVVLVGGVTAMILLATRGGRGDRQQ